MADKERKRRTKKTGKTESGERSNIVWNVGPNSHDIKLLATCGSWQAELAYKDIYSEGLVFVKYKGEKEVPAFFGHRTGMPEAQNVILLIAEVSKRMVERLTCSQPCGCKCQNVYVVSLNEGDFEKVQRNEKASLGVHFRLLPRYQHDEYFLKRINEDGTDNDGFALMAEWRKQYLRREKGNKLPDWQKSRKEFPEEWKKSAKRIREKLKKAVEESQKCC